MNIDAFLLRLFPGAASRNWGQMHIQGEKEGPPHPLIFLKDKDTSPKSPENIPSHSLVTGRTGSMCLLLSQLPLTGLVFPMVCYTVSSF